MVRVTGVASEEVSREQCVKHCFINVNIDNVMLRYTYIHTYSFITSCQTQPYMRAEIAQPTAKTIVTQLQFVLY